MSGFSELILQSLYTWSCVTTAVPARLLGGPAIDWIEISLTAWNWDVTLFWLRGPVGLLNHVFKTQLQLRIAVTFTCCLCRTSRSAQGDNMGACQVFPEHAYSLTLAHILGLSQSFPKFLWKFHFSALKLFVSLLFALTIIHHVKQPQIKQLPVCLCCSISTVERPLCSGQAPNQVKDRQLKKWSLAETHQIGPVVILF